MPLGHVGEARGIGSLLWLTPWLLYSGLTPLCIQVDSLICRLPYKQMLASLNPSSFSESSIPYVTRAYEESFMREPVYKEERSCARDKGCECMFIDTNNPFVCVEFLLPGERPPPTPNLCVLCSRATTQQLYYDIMFDDQVSAAFPKSYPNATPTRGFRSTDAPLGRRWCVA
jgi:hypothetical protein